MIELDWGSSYTIDDLTAAAVPDRDIDERSIDAGGGILGLLEQCLGLLGQCVESSHRMQPPLPLAYEIGDCVLDDAEKCGELWLRAIEIVGREQPQRDDLDTGLITPAEEVDDLGGARAMACRG